MIKIIADVPWTGDPLQGTIGNNGWLGGSEQEVNAFRAYLSLKLKTVVPIIASQSLTEDAISLADFYIVVNFWLLPDKVKLELAKKRNYIIIEHDFKFCPRRVPNVYKDNVVPAGELKHEFFYRSAKKVFCLSENQKKIFDKNLPGLDIELLHTSFWLPQEFTLIEDCINSKPVTPIPLCAVYNYLHDTKGTKPAVEWCNNHGKLILLLTPTDKKTFIRALSLCESLVFFPTITESYSRIAAESRMLGLDVIHNYNVSFMLEPWLNNLKGIDLINKFRQELIPQSIDKVIGFVV